MVDPYAGHNPYEAPTAPLRDASSDRLPVSRRGRSWFPVYIIGGVAWLGWGLLFLETALSDRPGSARLAGLAIGLGASAVGLFLLDLARRSVRFAHEDQPRVE